jgi:ATP-dependent helicase/nuclease subunit A
MMDLTKEQKTAVTTLDTDVCVTAGAGSGKTLVLALRYIEILRRGLAEVGDIVAITFTEKAAKEMRERIRAYCDQEIAQSVGKPELLKKWRGHKRDLEGARISTIHGLCSRILRENPVEAGVDPEFNVIDENAATILASQVVDDAVESLLVSGDAHLRRIIEEYGVRRTKVFLRYLLGRLEDAESARILFEQRDDKSLIDFYGERLADAQAEIARALSVRDEWKGAVGVLSRNPCKNTSDKLYPFWSLALEAAHEIRKAKTNRDAADGAAKMLGIKLNVGSAGNWDDLRKVKEALRALREMVEPHEESLSAKIGEDDIAGIRLARDFLAVHAAVKTQYETAKNETGALTFEDLEIKTRDLLVAKLAVRHELQRNMRFILVDEFQDVNPIQHDIIWRLAGKADSGKARGASPNLFFVGDDKQSIYRFRGADVTVFTKTRAEIDNVGRTVSLDTNFRTVPEGVSFANTLFGALMRKDRTSKPYHAIYENIKPHRKPLPAQPFTELNLLRYDSEAQIGADALRRMEARAVASRILELTSSGKQQVFDEKDKKWITPRYRHIALLFRKLQGRLYAYERAFQEANIPYHVTAGSDFYERPEVQDVLNMLRVIDNPGDDYALAGVLRSSLFAMSDEALYWLSTLKGGSFAEKFRSGAECREMPPEERQKLDGARKAIALLRPLKDRVSLPELINRILDSTGFEAVLATTFNGARKIANLRKMVEVARSFESSGIFSLRDFIRYIGDFLTQEMRESQAPVEEEEQDVVRIMTVHKAKGLEFPIVIIPDICPKSDRIPDRGQIGLSPEIGLSPRLPDRPGRPEPPNGIYNLYLLEDDLKEQAESKRLLYVATTRARDRLFLSACLRKGEEPRAWLEDLGSSLNLSFNRAPEPSGSNPSGLVTRELDCMDFEKPLQFRRAASKIQEIIGLVASVKQDPKGAASPLAGRAATLAPSLAAKKSFNPTELVEYQYCPRKYYYHFVCGYPQILAGQGKEGDVAAVTVGDISHRLFEMLRPGDRDGQIDEAIKAEGKFAEAQTKELKDTMRDFLRRFDATPLAKTLAAARESWEEVSFAARCDNALIEGKMDRVFRDETGAPHILDYKSDLVPDGKFEDKLQRYRLQLGAYAIGLRAALGEVPKSASLYFFRYGRTAALPITEKAIDGFRSEILRVIADIRANRFDRRTESSCVCGFEWLCKANDTH